MGEKQVPVSSLSFVDRATGDDKTEAARAILREKAPELLELMAQVRHAQSTDFLMWWPIRTSLPRDRDGLFTVTLRGETSS